MLPADITVDSASVANVLVYPLDLVASRLQTKTPQDKNAVKSSRRAKKDVYANLFVAIETIYRSTGINGFYQGIAADTLATAIANFLYFYVYSALHKLRARSKIAASGNADRKITFSGPEELVIGCLAGILSRAVTTPLSAIAVRKQTASKPSASDDADKDSKASVAEDETQSSSSYHPETSMDIARDIYESYGISGFWRGYSSACALVSVVGGERARLTHDLHADHQSGHHILSHRRPQDSSAATRPSRQSDAKADILHFCECGCDVWVIHDMRAHCLAETH